MPAASLLSKILGDEMKKRWLRLLSGWLVVVAILARPLGADQDVELLAAQPSGTPTPGLAERARAVPREAEERDRLRATQATRAPSQETSQLATATQATGVVVQSAKFGLAVADVTTGSGSTLEKADQTGAGWMMGWVSWRSVEPSRGTFAWQSGAGNDLDNVANGGRYYGLKVLARIQDAPAWATYDGSGKLSQVNPDDLRQAMEGIARRGAGRVAAYQLFNEPNLNYEWGADVVDAKSAARYAVLLNAAYSGIKAGDPSAIVVSAGTANGATSPSMNDLDFVRAFYAAGARGSFDALGTHPYGGNTEPESTTCGGTCFRRAELQRQIMVEYGDSATPMWATEVGWLHTSSYDMGPYFEWQKVSAQQQADYLVRAFQFAEANWPWMGPMFVFNHDHSTAMWCGGPCYPPTSSVHWFSVLNPDRTPRPAYTALASMSKTSTPITSTPTTTPTVTPTATATPTPGVGLPAAPSNLTATALSASQIRLAWTDNASNEQGFRIQRSLNGTSWAEIATRSSNVVTYQDSGLSPNTTYYYRVLAYNAVGESPYSNPVKRKTPRR